MMSDLQAIQAAQRRMAINEVRQLFGAIDKTRALFRDGKANDNLYLSWLKGRSVRRWTPPDLAPPVRAEECDEKGLDELIASARRGAPHADFVLRDDAADLLAGGRPLPEPLRSYTAGALHKAPLKQKRGPSPSGRKARDALITSAVKLLVKRGFKPTRNRASRDPQAAPSACSIVVEVLKERDIHMSEVAIEKIWSTRGRAG